MSDVEEIAAEWRRMRRKAGRQDQPIPELWLRRIDGGKWLDPQRDVAMEWDEWARDHLWCAHDEMPDDEEDEMTPVTRPPIR